MAHTQRFGGKDQFDEIINKTPRMNNYIPRKIVSLSGWKSMANISVPMLPDKSKNQISLLNTNTINKKQSCKYKDFYSWIDNDNQILTHIDLNVFEMKGNMSICITDVLSFLRRFRSTSKIPESVLKYLKTNVKLRRYNVESKTAAYDLHRSSLIFEYLMRELKLTIGFKKTPMVGPKLLGVKFYKPGQLW